MQMPLSVAERSARKREKKKNNNEEEWNRLEALRKVESRARVSAKLTKVEKDIRQEKSNEGVSFIDIPD